MFNAVAFEDNTDAPITIPGTLTNLDIVSASRLRMEISPAEEWRRSWCSGRTISFCEGYTMRRVQLFRAASNYGNQYTIIHILQLRGTYERDNLCWLGSQPMRQLFIKGDQLSHIHIAVVLL
jgi:hypothetical protein